MRGLAAILLMTILVLAPLATTTAQQQKIDLVGPHVDEVVVRIFVNEIAETFALLAGEIDVMDWPLPSSQIEELRSLERRGLLVVDSYAEAGIRHIDINNRNHPMSDPEFRKAIAYLVPKSRVVTELLRGFGYAAETMLPQKYYGAWFNTNAAKYPYNPAEAARVLDAAGYVKGADGWRVDPKTGAKLRSINFIIRSDDTVRNQLGKWIAEDMEKAGIPVKREELPFTPALRRFLQEYTYDMYTGGYGLPTDPNWLYSFHSKWDTFPEPFADNNMGYRSAEFDKWADILWTSSNYEEVLQAVQKAQEAMQKDLPMIPVFSFTSLTAANSAWEGWINKPGDGFYKYRNLWSLLTAHKKDALFGGTMRVGWKADFTYPNPVNPQTVWDSALLGMFYEGLMDLDPFTVQDIPAMALSWKTDKHTTADGKPGVKITYTIRQDSFWPNGQRVTAKDYKFTYDFFKKVKAPGWKLTLDAIEKVEAPDDNTLIIFTNNPSYFILRTVDAIALPPYIWESVAASGNWQTFIGDLTKPEERAKLQGNGAFIFEDYRVGELIVVKTNKDYYRKHPDKKIGLQPVSVPAQINPGATGTFSVKAVDYAGAPITTGEVGLAVAGRTIPLTHVGGGVYSVSLPPPHPAGTLQLTFTAKYAGPKGVYSKNPYTASLAATTSVVAGAAPQAGAVAAPAQTLVQAAPGDTSFPIVTGLVVLIIVFLAIGFVVARLRVPGAEKTPAPAPTT